MGEPGDCPLCNGPTIGAEVRVEGRHGRPVPNGTKDVCTAVIVAPVPGVVLFYHDHEVDEEDVYERPRNPKRRMK